MVIFHSYVSLPEGKCLINAGFNLGKSTVSVGHLQNCHVWLPEEKRKLALGLWQWSYRWLFDKLSLSRFLRNDLYTRYRSVPHIVFMLGTYLPTCPFWKCSNPQVGMLCDGWQKQQFFRASGLICSHAVIPIPVLMKHRTRKWLVLFKNICVICGWNMVKRHSSLCHDSAFSNWLSTLCSRILGTNDVRSFLVWNEWHVLGSWHSPAENNRKMLNKTTEEL